MAYQSLYRRYRPQKFSEIRGQRHVVAALQNAVVKDEVGHAYMFHGPRGTGKTSSARVLAKALNCENRGDDGEPCGECESCLAIEQGRSFDLHELDAASNNGVDAMRDLLAKVSLGTPGRAKVYILDEVHMLTAGAENALLKTLEEPPAHVTWVLATTEPHKVVSTIRSRCQVFELNLLGAEEMVDHVKWIVADAELDVDEAAIEHVVATGEGSVRDTLSALDRVVAAGGLVEVDTSTEVLLEAIAAHDTAAALAAVVDATGRGSEPRRIGENAVSGLRDAFLVAMGSPPPTLAGEAKKRAEGLAEKFSPAAMTRALETIGSTLIDMRQAPDPRVILEVALVRVCRAETDQSIDALTQRIEQLERRLAEGATVAGPVETAPAVAAPPPASRPSTPPPATPPPVTPPPVAPPTPAPSATGGSAGPAAARRAMADRQKESGPSESAPAASASSGSGPPRVPPSTPDDDPQPPVDPATLTPATAGEVVELATQHLGITKAQVVSKAGDMLGERTPGGSWSEEQLAELWAALLSEHQTKVEEPAPETKDAEEVDLNELVDAPDHENQLLEQLSQAFPGAELVDTKDDQIDD